MLHVFLPHELITEVLSFLPVRSLMRLKCVCKSWKNLISNSTFVKLHLKRSARKHLALFSKAYQLSTKFNVSLLRLLDDTSVTITYNDPYFQLKDDCGCIYPVGCYNGLVCLLGYFINHDYVDQEISFYLWNPATGTLSNKIEFLHDNYDRYRFIISKWEFAFGYDNSSETYKIVAFCLRRNEVRVFGFGDNVWKNIQSFPVVPFDHEPSSYHYEDYSEWFCHYEEINRTNHGVYLSDTINWLAIRKESQYGNEHKHDSIFITIDQFVIISLHLSTETYRQLPPPQSFDKVRFVKTYLSVLMDSLCFCHDFNGTDFIIWQMKKFGIQESWIKFVKISYHSLPINSPLVLFPLCLSENGDTLILGCNSGESQAILYNLRDNIVEKIETNTNRVSWFHSKDYVESLVSIC